MSLIDLSASELLDQLQGGQVTSVELTRACLERIESVDPQVGAFLAIRRDAALAEAEAIDQDRAAGKPLGTLAGLPIAIKDVLCTSGEATTCGSKYLEHFKPPYDAQVIERLRAAGAVLIGKTNMDEFAMGSSTENSALGVTRNPWNLKHIPGGSSGGSAAAVAAGMSPASIGSDTGGSIRQPAAFCGVTGLKPTYGRVSRYGLVAFASSLDQVGPFGRSVEDCARLLEAIAGHDPRDSTSLDDPVPPYAELSRQPLAGVTLGLVREHFEAGLDPEIEAAVREAVDVYRSLGATIKDVSLPHGKYGVATYYIIAPCEASSNLARYDGVHYGHRTEERALRDQLRTEQQQLEQAGDEEGLRKLDTALVRMYRQSRDDAFGTEVKRRIMIGTYALSAGYYDAYYVKALKVRRMIRNDYDRAFGEVDLLIGPCTPTPPFELGEKLSDPLAMYLLDLYTVSANLAGVAGLSLPCGLTKRGLPIGLQLQSAALDETRLLQAGHMFQQATDWHTKRPSL